MSRPKVNALLATIKANKPVITVTVPHVTFINGRLVPPVRGTPSELVPVADYLTKQFATSQAPFYRDPANLQRALVAIRADRDRAIRLGDTETAAKLQRDIEQLEAL